MNEERAKEADIGRLIAAMHIKRLKRNIERKRNYAMGKTLS